VEESAETLGHRFRGGDLERDRERTGEQDQERSGSGDREEGNGWPGHKKLADGNTWHNCM
jgi:hypothetical protein